MQYYDAIIIGAGQAGPTLAGSLADAGLHVALLEGGKIGGTCVNYGCTPTKTLRAAARVAYQVRRAAEYGIHTGEIRIDLKEAMGRTKRRVTESRNGLTSWLESVENLDIIRAYGKLIGTKDGMHQVQAGEDLFLEAPLVYLNVGARPFVPPVAGLDEVNFLTSDTIWELERLPEHIIILGGGYIGLEMAQIFARLGSQVSVIEFSPRLATREDEDVSEEIERILSDEGIMIYTGHKAVQVAQNADDPADLEIVIEDADGQQMTLSGSHLLVATGRKLNTDSLNLGAVGVETNQRGVISTNGQLETSVEGIFALGDINGRGAFTHTSYHDYQIVFDNWKGANRNADDRTMVYAMFTDPPMGRVGMSEREARESGKNILVMKHYAKNVSRAKEDGELNGLVKIVVDADTEQILGACTFIMQGDDVIQSISNFMATGASYRVMQQALPVHPTISEYLPTWLSMLKPAE